MTKKHLCGLVLVAGLFLMSMPLSAQNEKFTALQWFDVAQNASRRDNWYTAIEAYKRALEINPAYRAALEGLAEAFFIQREYDEAARILTDAKSIGPYTLAMKTLLGRVYLGQGKLQEAWDFFQEVLKAEPQNLEALMGTAEHEILRSRFQSAEQIYQKILQQNPSHFRTLMSLVFLKQDRKDVRGIPALLDRLLQSHSHDGRVHYYASVYWQKEGQIARAKEFLSQHLKITKGDGVPGRLLMAQLLMEEKQFAEALKYIDEALVKDNQNTYGWYLKGYAQGLMGAFSDSAVSLGRAVFLDKENEIYKIALENPFIRQEKLEAGPRKELAAYHFGEAQRLSRNLLPARALEEYRRGLLIHPDSPEGRLAFARMMHIQGFKATSVLTLNFIKNHIPTFQDRGFLDDHEIETSLFRSSLPAEWGYGVEDLTSLPHERPYQISLFYSPELTSLPYFGAEKDLSYYVQDELSYFRKISVSGDPEPIDSSVRAFQNSRNRKDHFFILFSFREGNRDFFAKAELYHSGTGRKIQDFTVYKKGQNRTTGALRELAQMVVNFFPAKGAVIERRNSRFLINLGTRDGIAKDTLFQIIRENTLKIPGQTPFFTFTQDDLLGQVKITKVDDFVSEGIFEKNGFFDVAAVRDEAITLTAPTLPPPTGEAVSLSDLQRKILSLR